MVDYGKSEYWEERYQRDSEQFDWYQSFHGIEHLISNRILQTDRILHVGCGNSSTSLNNLSAK